MVAVNVTRRESTIILRLVRAYSSVIHFDFYTMRLPKGRMRGLVGVILSHSAITLGVFMPYTYVREIRRNLSPGGIKMRPQRMSYGESLEYDGTICCGAHPFTAEVDLLG